MKLYEISARYQQLLKELDSADELIGLDLERRLDAIEEALDEKVDNICGLMATIDHEAEAARQESQRLSRLASIRYNAATRLKAYLMQHFQEMGLAAHQTEKWKVSICKNGRPSIDFYGDPEKLPRVLRKVAYELDKAAVLEWQKLGQDLPDGVTIKHGQHLRIT